MQGQLTQAQKFQMAANRQVLLNFAMDNTLGHCPICSEEFKKGQKII
jgi:hypothetical protein